MAPPPILTVVSKKTIFKLLAFFAFSFSLFLDLTQVKEEKWSRIIKFLEKSPFFSFLLLLPCWPIFLLAVVFLTFLKYIIFV